MKFDKLSFEQRLTLLVRLTDLLYPGTNIRVHIEDWQSKFTASQQRKGLDAAFADLAEDGFALSLADRRNLDKVLSSEGLTTLSEVQALHSRRIQRLLKKKRLSNEEEGIVLKSMVDANLLSPNDVQIVERLIANFPSVAR
jgi:hypothetical protein